MSDRAPDSANERRDSPRIPMRLQVRSAGGGPASQDEAFREYEGDLSLGGIAIPVTGPASSRYEVRIRLPERELLALAEPVSSVGSRDRLQLRFVELDTASELALARFLHAAVTR